jgi:hypothetical protein
MHAPFQPSAKFLISSTDAGRLLLPLKALLAPDAEPEPGCSKHYAALYRQARRATRLFWLASALAVGSTLAVAVAETLR